MSLVRLELRQLLNYQHFRNTEIKLVSSSWLAFFQRPHISRHNTFITLQKEELFLEKLRLLGTCSPANHQKLAPNLSHSKPQTATKQLVQIISLNTLSWANSSFPLPHNLVGWSSNRLSRPKSRFLCLTNTIYTPLTVYAPMREGLSP